MPADVSFTLPAGFVPRALVVEPGTTLIKGEDSDEATYDSARKLLQATPNILGVYNVAGGNRGLSQALAELQRAAPRPIYVTHEINRVTEPLLRTQQIDYLIVQDLDEIVGRATRFMHEIPDDDRGPHALEHVPFRLLTPFNIG